MIVPDGKRDSAYSSNVESAALISDSSLGLLFLIGISKELQIIHDM